MQGTNSRPLTPYKDLLYYSRQLNVHYHHCHQWFEYQNNLLWWSRWCIPLSSIIKVLTSSWSKGSLKGAPKLGVPNQNFFGKSEMGCFTKQNDCWLKVNLVLARTSLTLYYVRATCFTLCTNGPWGLERQVYRKDTLGLFGQSPWSTKKK